MPTTNRELAARAQAIAKGSDGLQRRAANTAAIALSTTTTVGAARSALADLWQRDVRDAALELIGRLATIMPEDAP